MPLHDAHFGGFFLPYPVYMLISPLSVRRLGLFAFWMPMRCSMDTAVKYEQQQAAECGRCRAFHRVKGKRQCHMGIPADEMAKCRHFIQVQKKPKKAQTKESARQAAEALFSR